MMDDVSDDPMTLQGRVCMALLSEYLCVAVVAIPSDDADLLTVAS